MSDPKTPSSTPQKPAFLDKLGSKIIFSLICFLSPAPLAIIIADCWLRYQGKLPETAINPIYFIKQGMTSLEFAVAWPMLVAMLPAALILMILFRDAKSRVIMLALLLVASLLSFTCLASLSTI